VVKVVFKASEESYSLTMTGHADYNPGNDIVCSAVSALAYTLAGALEFMKARKAYTNLNEFELEHTENPGDFLCKVSKVTLYAEYKIKAVFQTIFIGLKQIEQQFPEHINIVLEDEKKLILGP
jgi:uncharacterized protein YsxB (DUF464 family)